MEQEKFELIKKNQILQRQIEDKNPDPNFNSLSEIQLLSVMVLLFSKYKNKELEEKNCLIIEKYLMEGQNNLMQNLNNSLNQLKHKNHSLLEKMKTRVKKLINYLHIQKTFKFLNYFSS